MVSERPPVTSRPSPGALLQAPPTRREALLFGLLILAMVWLMVAGSPRTVLVVPDTHVKVGVIT